MARSTTGMRSPLNCSTCWSAYSAAQIGRRTRPQVRPSSSSPSRARSRTARVPRSLCRLAQDGEALEAALGDGVTTTLTQILISTYDGGLDASKA